MTAEEATPTPMQITQSSEDCTFDLYNLTAFNVFEQPYPPSGPPTSSLLDASTQNFEMSLLQSATISTAQLVTALFSLPFKSSDIGPLALLPTVNQLNAVPVEGNTFTLLPREKTPPVQPGETKWEKFAKEKGIMNEKRGRKTFDEATNSWVYRSGGGSGKEKEGDWPIMEVKRGDDPYADPWEKARETQAVKQDKNLEQRLRNMERAGTLERGTAAKTLKDRVEKREAGRLGNMMNENVPAGIAVDLYESGRRDPVTGRIDNNGQGKFMDPKTGLVGSIKVDRIKRGKELTARALTATARSTASLGKFDDMRVGEPVRKLGVEEKRKQKKALIVDDVVEKVEKVKVGAKKVVVKKATPAAVKVVRVTEKEKSLKLLEQVLTGVSKKKEAKKAGVSLSTGETGHDYDYDDDAEGTFKRKKGRAGQGKMRKITKKNIH